MILVSCGNDDDEQGSGIVTPVTISTDFFFNAGYAPLLVAKENGYFEDEGVDATIQQGNPGVANTQALSEGEFDFLYGAIDEVPYAVANGVEVKAVAVFTHGNVNSIVVTGGSPIHGIEDLEGATVGVPLGGGPPYAMFPDILEASGVDADTVTIVEADFEVLGPSLLSGQFDAINAWYTTTPFLTQEDPNIRYYTYNELGFDFLGGLGLMTSSRMIEEEPEVVRAVTRAILRAWADSARDPVATISIAASSDYEEAFLEEEVQTEFLRLTLTGLETEETRARGLGYATDAEWQSLLDVAQEYGALDPVEEPAAYYTSEFLPEQPIQP